MNRSNANYNEMPSESPYLLEGTSNEAMRIEGHTGQSTAMDPLHFSTMHQQQPVPGNGNSSITMNCGRSDPSKMSQEMYSDCYNNSIHNANHSEVSYPRGNNRNSIPMSPHLPEPYFPPTHHHGHPDYSMRDGRAEAVGHPNHPVGMQQQQETHTFQPNRPMDPVPLSALRSPNEMMLGQEQHLDVAPPPPPPSFIYISSRSNCITTPIVKRVCQEVRSMTSGTRLRHATTNSNSTDDCTIQLLDRSQEVLQTHWVLGTGSFSLVTAVTIDSSDQPNSSNGQRYYACKAIKHELASMGGGDFVLAASQLAYEAHILSCLNHPNIIKVRGLDERGIVAFERINQGFVMLMDVLCETLEQRIDRWKKKTGRDNDNQNRLAVLLRRYLDKLEICLQLASALEFIHSKHIVYRDLKPANIGFSSVPSPNHPEGEEIYTRLQLFDFGLCHEFTPASASTTCTGVIGTIRYMAPEVCLDTNYDYNCDIYSYAVVCWELWTHLIPFESMTSPDLYREFVCRRGYRPYPDQTRHENTEPEFSLQATHPVVTSNNNPVPKEMLVLLSQAWPHDPNSRSSWLKIRKQLTLLKTLVDLQLEAQDLSVSATQADFDDDEDSNDNRGDYNYGMGYNPQVLPNYFTSNDDRPSW